MLRGESGWISRYGLYQFGTPLIQSISCIRACKYTPIQQPKSEVPCREERREPGDTRGFEVCRIGFRVGFRLRMLRAEPGHCVA